MRLYDRLTRVAPGYAYAWSNKGNAQIALGDLESGLDAYKRAIEVRSPFDQSAMTVAAAVCAIRPLHLTSSNQLHRIVTSQLLPGKSGDAWLVYLNKATTELALGRVGECLTDLDEARALHGQPDVLLFANKALALERLGKYPEVSASRRVAVVVSWWKEA